MSHNKDIYSFWSHLLCFLNRSLFIIKLLLMSHNKNIYSSMESCFMSPNKSLFILELLLMSHNKCMSYLTANSLIHL